MRRMTANPAECEELKTAGVDQRPDRSLMLGMGNASTVQIQNAVRRACELMRSHPEVRQQVEVQDTRGATSNAQRLACPR